MLLIPSLWTKEKKNLSYVIENSLPRQCYWNELNLQSSHPLYHQGTHCSEILSIDTAHYIFTEADHEVCNDMTDRNWIYMYLNYIFDKIVYFLFVNTAQLWYIPSIYFFKKAKAIWKYRGISELEQGATWVRVAGKLPASAGNAAECQKWTRVTERMFGSWTLKQQNGQTEKKKNYYFFFVQFSVILTLNSFLKSTFFFNLYSI